MSETLTITVDPVEGSAKTQRTSYAKSIRSAIADEKRAAITAGCYLMLAKATFTADELDEWKAWSVEVTRKSYKTVESYLAVGKAYTSSTKALQKDVSGWTFEALQAYASVPEDDRAAVVKAVKAEDSNPSPEVVRTARDIVKDEKLTDAERAEKDSARRKREKANAASKTEALAKDLAPILNRLKSDDAFKAFALGVEVGISHKDGKLIEAAVKLHRTNREKAAEVVQRAAEKVAASK